jgi:hypothetical protein
MALASLALIATTPASRAGGQEPPPPDAEANVGELEPPSRFEEIGLQAVDAVIVRPLGAVAVAVGAAFFAISVPLVAASGGIRESFEFFVMGPVEYTFVRPLGDL